MISPQGTGKNSHAVSRSNSTKLELASEPKKSPKKKKSSMDKYNKNLALFEDNDKSRLVDLFNSNFDMSPNDVDYKLNHDQLIKVCKVLLHKVNYNHKKGVTMRN